MSVPSRRPRDVILAELRHETAARDRARAVADRYQQRAQASALRIDKLLDDLAEMRRPG